MIWKPKQLGRQKIEERELEADKKNCRRFGPCGVGQKALYLNSFYFDRRYYVALDSVSRVFKRVAMSKGGFSGKGMFATIPYLVVQYDGGEEKQCIFKREEQVDALLDHIRSIRPEMPVHSVQAEKKLLEKQRILEQKKARIAFSDAREEIQWLEKCAQFLEKRPELYRELSSCAKRKRTYDKSNPAYKWAALFITLMGIEALVYGIYALVTKAGFGIYFLLFGLAAIFFFSSANVLPTARNNRRYVEDRLKKATEAMYRYIAEYPKFPLPACYAHPAVLRRMIDIIAQERTRCVAEALELLKQDLKAMNSSVELEQEEYDEVMAIKPMFLVRDYE